MRKLLCLAIAVLMLVSCSAFAADFDLSGMSYDELVALKDKINLAIWNSQEWQEVTVPVGVWEVGKDIPAGHWSITASKDSIYGWGSINYCDHLDASGKKPGYGEIRYHVQVKYEGSEAAVEATSVDLDLKDGTYLIIEYAPMIFTPYTGKPDLGFH